MFPTELSAEWNGLHEQVIESESIFLLHSQKEVLEIRSLAEVIEDQFRERMYLILLVSGVCMFLIVTWIDYKITNTMGKIK